MRRVCRLRLWHRLVELRVEGARSLRRWIDQILFDGSAFFGLVLIIVAGVMGATWMRHAVRVATVCVAELLLAPLVVVIWG